MRRWTLKMCGASVDARPTPVALAQATGINRRGAEVVDMRLEVVVVPVAEVDRAKNFYKALGWREDADYAAGADFRVVQLTPPGSACSVIFGTAVTSAAPGSAQGLHLVVTDIDAARAELESRGADVSEVFHDAGGVFHHAGTEGRVIWPGSGPSKLRLVCLVQRSGRQRLAAPGDHHPPSGPVTRARSW
jgi:catechol 2,3-dioxygenase-like lactoylglutathione lyase family enzyme